MVHNHSTTRQCSAVMFCIQSLHGAIIKDPAYGYLPVGVRLHLLNLCFPVIQGQIVSSRKESRMRLNLTFNLLKIQTAVEFIYYFLPTSHICCSSQGNSQANSTRQKIGQGMRVATRGSPRQRRLEVEAVTRCGSDARQKRVNEGHLRDEGTALAV